MEKLMALYGISSPSGREGKMAKFIIEELKKMQELIAAKGLRQAVSEITSIPATDPVIEEIAAATAEVEKRIR